MWVIALALMVDTVDQYIPRGMVDQLKAAFHVSDLALGVLFSAFVLVNALVTVPAGYLADRWHRVRAMAVTIVVWSVTSALGGFVPVTMFGLLVGLRALLGFGQGITEPSASSLLPDYYVLERRGRAFSAQQSLLFVGIALGTLIGSLVGQHLGWRWGFFISLLPGLVVALLVLTLFEPRRGAADRARLAGHPDRVEPAGPREGRLFAEGVGRFLQDLVAGLRRDLKVIMSIPTMRFALVGVSALLFVVTAVGTWMPEFYQYQLGVSQSKATSAFLILVLVGGLPGVLFGGRIADRFATRITGARVAIPAVCLMVSTAGFIVSFLFLPFGACLALQVFSFFAATSAIPALRAGLTDAVPAHLRGTGFAAFNLASVLAGAAAAPVVTAALADAFPVAPHDGNFRIAFLVVMPVAFAGSVILFTARRHLASDTAALFAAVLAAMEAEAAERGEGAEAPPSTPETDGEGAGLRPDPAPPGGGARMDRPGSAGPAA
jgi:MFS family permease